MAERRMFSKTIIESDLFLDMPISARLLYYELGMRGDDDGFVDSPKKITRMVGAADDDLRLLATKGYIIPFQSGVVVITHWKTHNYIRSDRYKETQHLTEKRMLKVEKNGNYALLDTTGIPSDNQPDTAGIPSGSLIEGNRGEGRLGEDRVGKDNTAATTARADEPREYVAFYNSNIGPIVPHIAYEAETFIDDGLPDELIVLALQRAVEAGARNWMYAKSILQRWVEGGIKTVAAAQAEAVEFRNRSPGKNGVYVSEYEYN